MFQVSIGGTELVLNMNNGDLPLNGLEFVTMITIIVSEDSELSDVYLHACNVPGMYKFDLAYLHIPTTEEFYGNLSKTEFLTNYNGFIE